MKRQIASLVSLLAILVVAGACASAPVAPAAPKRNPLLDPATLTATAPDMYQVRFETSKGPFVVEVNRAWAPQGADRFYNLVQNHYYDDVRFFRVVSGFMAQFGLHGDPAINTAWDDASIQDDPVVGSNTRGTMTFAMAGPNSRTTQVYINLVDNVRLDRMGFAPFGRVIEGMEVVDALHSGYGEGAPRGRGPRQDRIGTEGNAYLAAEFPELDYVVSARIVK
jgi:peptidyl-prolyl cis-trans isomerase A (cyclophilin A)